MNDLEAYPTDGDAYGDIQKRKVASVLQALAQREMMISAGSDTLRCPVCDEWTQVVHLIGPGMPPRATIGSPLPTKCQTMLTCRCVEAAIDIGYFRRCDGCPGCGVRQVNRNGDIFPSGSLRSRIGHVTNG